MSLDGIEARLLTTFREAKTCKLLLDNVQQAFSRACPEWNNRPDRRTRLAEALDRLAALALIALPANRKKDWQTFVAPALPNWIRVAREKSPIVNKVTFDHARFPWVQEMRFVSSLPVLPAPEEARQIHDFFKAGGSLRPIVPTKERSWEIFGYEKRLEELLDGKLFFGPDRLTLQMLRCSPVSYSLVYQPSRRPSSGLPIILENEATFHSFARLNAVTASYEAVIFGNGQAVLKGTPFLANLSQSYKQRTFLYFGDLDAAGLRIASDLSKQLAACQIQLQPAEAFYAELIATPQRAKFPSENVSKSHLSWLPNSLMEQAIAKLANGGRVAQEALGWEKLCRMFSTDPATDFYAGF